MFKIGDFSKLSRVSVKTLRYYDELGLFKPAHIDRFTGYRFYRADQMPQLNRILALKDLGFSLDEITRLLDEEPSTEQLRRLLRRKHAELQQRVQDEQARLVRVEVRLHMIEQEGKMSTYEVVLKQIEPQLIVSARGVITSPENRLIYRDGAVFAEGDLVDLIGQQCRVLTAGVCELLPHTGLHESDPWILVYNQTEQTIDLEMALVVEGTPRTVNDGRIGVRLLPGVEQMASVVHHGSYTTLQQAYTALGRWLEVNGYKISGACREIYLRGPDDPITEVQFPVEKI